MVAAASSRVPVGSTCFDDKGSGWRAHAVTVRAGEPAPLRRLPDGQIGVIDCRFEPSAVDWQTPPDEAGALVLIDPIERRVRLLRDRLGQQPLVWARLADGVLVASREYVLLGLDSLPRNYDDEFLASHLALVDPPGGRTLYRAIEAVDPGSRVDLTSAATRVQRLAFDPDPDAFKLSDASAIERFRELMSSAVTSCAVGASRVGLTLSGGLDSSSIAALLPASIRRSRSVALTYGTQFGGSIDERELASDLCAHLAIPMVTFDSAEHPPTLQPDRHDLDPGYPFVNPYHPLRMATYRVLASLGADIVLTGHYADHWNPGPVRWLRHALASRRWDLPMMVYRDVWRSAGARGMWREPGWRHLARHLLGWAAPTTDASWMLTEWRHYALDRTAQEAAAFSHWPVPHRSAFVLGTYAATDAAFEGFHSDPFGFQPRHPCRNWPLLRFALSLPAYQHVRGSTNKWIARQAVKADLPSRWAQRPKQGDLLPLLRHHVYQTELSLVRQLIESAEPIWGRYVDADKVRKRLVNVAETREADFLLFRLACMGTWLAGHGTTLGRGL